MNDLLKTQIQETGSCYVNGLTLIEIAEIVHDIGLDPRSTRIIDGDLVVTDDRLVGGKEVTLR